MHILLRGITIVYFYTALVLGFWIKRQERHQFSRISYAYMDGTLLEPIWRYPISPIVEWVQINRRFVLCSLLTLSGILKLLPCPHPGTKRSCVYRFLSILIENFVGLPQIWIWLLGLTSDNSLEPSYYPSILVQATGGTTPLTFETLCQFLFVKSSIIFVVGYGIYLTKKAMWSLAKKENQLRHKGVVSKEYLVRTVVILVVCIVVFWGFIVNQALSMYFDPRGMINTFLFSLFLVCVLYGLMTQCQEFHVKVFLVGASLFIVNLLFQEIYRSYLLGHVYFISSSHLVMLHYLCYYSTLSHISTNEYSEGYQEYENIAENSSVKLVSYIQVLFGIIQVCVSISLLRFIIQAFSPAFKLEKQFSDLIEGYKDMFWCTVPNVFFLVVVFGYKFDGSFLPYKFALFPHFRKEAFRFSYDFWSPATILVQQFKAVAFIIVYYIYTFTITPNEINFLFADIVTIEVFLISVRVAFTFPQGTSPFDTLESVHWSQVLNTDESCYIPLKTSFQQYVTESVSDEDEAAGSKQAKHPKKSREKPTMPKPISSPSSQKKGKKCMQGRGVQTQTIEELKQELIRDESTRQGHKKMNYNFFFGNFGGNIFLDCKNNVSMTDNSTSVYSNNTDTAEENGDCVLETDPSDDSS
ncbi:unnamed protein product [Owenia fusiformis]|uniref:Uncharacterized protein n=1 Tax=Owenia fusiformis TaxID=6347 RepID=A0A8J1XIV7_OWEFU|nr:unnamed protein product [Owenia fusiformis]